MGRSTFQRKLIKSAKDAAAMKVHSEEEPPEFCMRLIKALPLGNETAQQKAFCQYKMADGCLFYGNDALRSRGGCCICLLMASGLSAKRFSIWVADADEGEFTYTTFSKRFKLAIFIILPRLLVYHILHQCASQPKMDDNRQILCLSGGHEKTTKDFLTYSVRLLSRLYVDKTSGQEVVWKHCPLNWPKDLTWKNPTSSPKDNTKTLLKKYQYLRLQVPNEKLSQEEQKAFEDFEKGNINSMQSFITLSKCRERIKKIKEDLPYLQEQDRMLLAMEVKLLESSSFISLPVTTSPKAADTSTLPGKRKSESLTSVESKKSKTDMPNCGNCIQNNNGKRKRILPKSTKSSPNALAIDFVPSTVGSQSTAVEIPLRNTAFKGQPQWSVLSSNTAPNTFIDRSACTTVPYHTEAAAAGNVQPSMAASPIIIFCTTKNLHSNSHEESLKTVSHSIPTSSVDSGNWSQESSITQATSDIMLYQQNLSHKDVQNNLQTIENFYNSTEDQNNDFDPSEFINFEESALL